MIFHDTRRVADRNATCQETWRVGECHVPDTRDMACHDKSCPGYVNRGVSKNFKGLIRHGYISSWNECVLRTTRKTLLSLHDNWTETINACARLSPQNFIVKEAQRTYGRLFSFTSLYSLYLSYLYIYYQFIILRQFVSSVVGLKPFSIVKYQGFFKS